MLETSFPPLSPFLGLAAREDSTVAEEVDLLQVQEEKAKARMKISGPVSTRALGVTLRNMQSLHARKETRGDGRALLHPNKIRCTNYRRPRVVSALLSPGTRAGSPELSVSARLPSLPTATVPKCLVPCKGRAQG